MFSYCTKLGAVIVLATALVGCAGKQGYGSVDGSASSSNTIAEQIRSEAGDTVLFEFDSSMLTAEAKETIERQSRVLSKHPHIRIVVEGHCDERGTSEYNIALGERRANAVSTYLKSLGIHHANIEVISYGKERPAVEGHDENAWRLNRRGVTTVAASTMAYTSEDNMQ